MSKKWSDLAGLCSAQGVAYAGDENEKELIQLLKRAGVALPKVEKEVVKKEKEEKKEVVNDTLEEAQKAFEEEFGKPVPNNKKNDINWINSKLNV